MIRIVKPANAPAILSDRGVPQTQRNLDNFNADPHSYSLGIRLFEFSNRIYGAKSVKAALRRAQHDKCCFCEAKVTHVSPGDVEHFRPKAGFRQLDTDDLARPGYFWLAYSWENLFFSCQLCNQRHKKNLFPLVDPATRAQQNHNTIDAEEPLFIDPGRIDPAEHISFRQEIAFPTNNSRRGAATIQGLGLNREEINDRRRHHLETLKLIKILAESTLPGNQEARRYLLNSGQDNAEYAAMTRVWLAAQA